jgi:hypothetical protein
MRKRFPIRYLFVEESEIYLGYCKSYCSDARKQLWVSFTVRRLQFAAQGYDERARAFWSGAHEKITYVFLRIAIPEHFCSFS